MGIANLLEIIVNEFCLPLTLVVRLDPIIHKPLFVGSFFIGFILGILIALPLIILYSKNWSIKEKYLRRGVDIESYFLCCKQINTKKRIVLLPNKANSWAFRQTKKIQKCQISVTEKSETIKRIRNNRGMVDVLMQKNSDAVLEEVTKQDIEVLEKIEKDQNSEKEKMMMCMLEKLLIEESFNGTLPSDFCINDFMKNMEKDLQNINQMKKIDMTEEDVMIKRERLFRKTPLDTDLGCDKESGITNRIKREMKKERVKKIRNNFYQANIDNSVAERIKEKMEKLSATWDKHCTLEQKRISESLNKKQWSRRMVAEKQILIQMEEDMPLNESVSLLGNVLNTFVNNGQLIHKRCQELIDEFKRDKVYLRKQLNEDASQKLEELTRKLREKRLEELMKLEDKHFKEKQKFLDASKENQNFNTESCIQNYLSETTKMNTELENKLNELDQKEAEAMELFLVQVKQSHTAEVCETELDFFNDLKTKTNFTQNDVQKLIHQYKAQQKKYAAMCEKACRERESLFKEELEKQIEEQKERKHMAEAEQVAIFNEQESIMTKMLENNVNIDEEKKEEILKIHKQKMQELSNHLETTRIKQEQNLQVLLAQRRSNVKELKEEKERAAKEKQTEGNKKLQEKLNAEIEAAELKLEKEKSKAEEKGHQQLIEETKVILEQHHNELAAEIGKMEIAKARRKVFMDRQDSTLQCLHEKLEGLVGSERTPQGLSNQIVQRHQNVMHHLEQQQKAEREKQQRILQAKIEQKHLQKQRELTKEFHELKEFQGQKQKGTSAAASILCNILLEKRHEENKAALEKEMKAELEKKCRGLDVVLENKLNKELKQQRQNFLVELAAISDLDKDEVKDLISQVVMETKASKKTKKKLTQNLTKELEKAKTELHVTEDERQ